jgi:transcriptional antiterminator Rof (Rho-off)
MKKCILEVTLKDGQKFMEQADFNSSEAYTEYLAFDGSNRSSVEEIKFIKFI